MEVAATPSQTAKEVHLNSSDKNICYCRMEQASLFSSSSRETRGGIKSQNEDRHLPAIKEAEAPDCLFNPFIRPMNGDDTQKNIHASIIIIQTINI